MESAPFLHQLIRYHPDHVKGLILLGDLYVNHMRDLAAAEKCYYTILEVEPDNIQARHNLCVVMVEGGNLLQARDCLVDCLKLKHEDYIVKHIQIIEERLGLPNSIVNQSIGGTEER
jgi:cytochrome c-type biogenesis protein CcmH/NrfG